jgi:hypothetical protein
MGVKVTIVRGVGSPFGSGGFVRGIRPQLFCHKRPHAFLGEIDVREF